jgi:hypothetical protein
MIFNVEKDAKRKKIPGSREKVKHSIDNISMPSILEEQQQQKPSLGVSGVNINPEIAKAMNLTQTSGFLVRTMIGLKVLIVVPTTFTVFTFESYYDR